MASPGYTITLSCPILIRTKTDDDSESSVDTVPTEDQIRALDGRVFDAPEESFAVHLSRYPPEPSEEEQEERSEEGVDPAECRSPTLTGGFMRLEYKPRKQEFWAYVEFGSPRKLDEEEIQNLLEDVETQLAKGVGDRIRQQHNLSFLCFDLVDGVGFKQSRQKKQP